ncbi:Aorsin, partial [Lachnellula suecica]
MAYSVKYTSRIRWILTAKMLLPSFLVLLALSVSARSAAVPNTHVVHEKREVTSRQWVKRGKLSSSAVLPMRIGLKQQNLHLGHDLLMDVSHPESKNYAKHWTAEEIIDKFAPVQKTVDSVKEWLTDFGIDGSRITHSDNKGWLAFDATTAEAEGLLHAKYHMYEHTSKGHVTPACESYHVPKHIQEHVDYITPGIKLIAPTKRGRGKRSISMTSSQDSQSSTAPLRVEHPEGFQILNANNVSGCDKQITPACIRALYKIPEVEYETARSDNALGIFEEGDFYSQQDLDLAFANFTPSIPKGTHPTPAFIDGASAPVSVRNAGGESDLDFELAYPIIYPQNVTLYQTDDLFYSNNPNSTSSGGFNTFLDALDGSYCTYSAFGETGNDPIDPVYPDTQGSGSQAYKGALQCGVYKAMTAYKCYFGLVWRPGSGSACILPTKAMQRVSAASVNNMLKLMPCRYMKLGLQGVSIFYASGDDGVAGPPGDGGSANGCLGGNHTIFNPAWPNSCPYLTNVGATKVYPGKTTSDPESAVVDPAGHPYRDAYSSGGGFSNIYPIPDYQKDAVAKFYNDHEPKYPHYSHGVLGEGGGLYNRSGRGYPDVAA